MPLHSLHRQVAHPPITISTTKSVNTCLIPSPKPSFAGHARPAHNQTSKCGKEPRSSNRKFYLLSHPMAPSKPLNTALLYMASVYTHTTSFLNRKAFTHRETFTHNKLLHREAFFLYTASFHTQQAFTHRTLTHSAFAHGKRGHTETLTLRRFYAQRSFYTQQAFTHKIFYTQQAFTQQAFTHRTLTHSAFTHGKRLKTQKHLHRDAFTHREAFTHSKLLHTASFYTQNLLHTSSLYRKNTQRNFLVHNRNRDCSSKTGSRRQSRKKTILKHF